MHSSIFCRVIVRKLTSHRSLAKKIVMECTKPKYSDYSDRLSPHIRPFHYQLLLNPDLKAGVFHGNVKIEIEVDEETKSLHLHKHLLNITNVKVLKETQEIAVEKVLDLKYLEQMSIELKNCIDSGEYQIDIDFNGSLTNGIVGLYLSTYKNNRTMVASKFQPTYARQAFPCFDEPDFNPFAGNTNCTSDFCFNYRKHYEIALEIANSLDPETDLETVTFATSSPMSTYLACFVICDFDYKEVLINAYGMGDNFKLRTYAQQDEIHKIDFALDIGKRATEYYIQYYRAPYPLPKLDMIAIPDYVSGATEHWGLITYRETQFLIDEETASAKTMIGVANTIAHELAHMWFGNLVTMKWWDEVWLNEGFASYMQVKALHAIKPSWDMLDQFLTSTLHPVLKADAKLSSHPIVQAVNTPDQITAIFDLISYKKGAAVLRMLEGFCGEDCFRAGVSDYFKKFKFGNTVTQDLLMMLEPYFHIGNPGQNITHIMDTWTRQMGYPVLHVTKGDEPNTYTITQKRFLLSSSDGCQNDSVYNYRWFVPITYRTNKRTSSKVLWFPDTAESVTLKLHDDESWLKLNNNQIGYYRVNYDTELWRKLIQELHCDSHDLKPSDRAHLLNDAFELSGAGLLPYELALDLSKYLLVERELVPWQTASTIFKDLSDKLMQSQAYCHLQKYVQKMINPLYEEQDWDKTDISISESLLRSLILSLALRMQLPQAESRMREKFLDWLVNHGTPDGVRIDPQLRDLIYFYGLKSATQAEWDKVWNIYLKESDVQEKATLRHALSAPRDPNILQRYLNLAWDETKVRSQDYFGVLTLISYNPSGTEIVWSDVRARWPQLVDRFTLNSRYLGGMISAITSGFHTNEKLAEMEEFFKQYPDAGAGETNRKQALETVKNNIKWANTYQSSITEWLQNNCE